jgi:competence protein CoiA
MQYALVEGGLREASADLQGNCPTCGAMMMPKCGSKIMHHWSHRGRLNCDPWWENETEWHRSWKNSFPESCREISHRSSAGEIHRADIKAPAGIYVELQHSALSDAERDAREEFYQNLIWIVDGSVFKKNFDLYHLLPNPSSQLAKDIRWYKAKRGMDGANRGIFWRQSEVSDEFGYAQMRFYPEIQEELENSYCGHQQYDWVRPRSIWLGAKCPVYIDFGDDCVFRLERYGETDLRCVFRVSKRKLIHDLMVESRSENIARYFYRIP